MKKTRDQPIGVYLQNGRYRSQFSIYDNRKAKYYAFSCSSFETQAQAVQARQLIIDLVGETPESKKKVRPWQVREVVNKYRIELGLKPLNAKDK